MRFCGSRLASTSPLLSRGYKKVLTAEAIPANIKNVQYAVRGELVLRALDHEKKLKSSPGSLPFSRITYCNIGNPQQLGQPPLTFFRQVISLLEYPQLLDHPDAQRIFPRDAIERARRMLKAGGPTGAYSHSQGMEYVREEVAQFINTRDGFKKDDYTYSNPENIFLTDGASPAVQRGISMTIRGPTDGIMIPIPQYPLYSASIPLYGGQQVSYYLNESTVWGLDVKELSRSVKEARSKGINPRALVVINPGNPTGAVLTAQNIKEIIDFCHSEGLLIMADEVYQENVYVRNKKPFVSFKKVLSELGSRYKGQELFSFHSVSKGFLGECGKRGGYVEFDNIDDAVKADFYKLSSVSLCPNVVGQVVVSLMVNPPKAGDESYALYAKERDAIYNSLKSRAEIVSSTMNKLPGISCQPPEGAMYAFPSITLPKKAIEAAKAKGKHPDVFYCLELLDKTGLCVVPGSGFGQREGTLHFRTTFLPEEKHLREVLDAFAVFHADFLKRFA